MAIRGTKPQATATKKRAGNPGGRPLNALEPTVDAGEPMAPEWLPAEAKAEWCRVMPILLKSGLVTHLERAILTSYCEAWATYVQASIDLSKYGAVMVSKKTGQPYQGPWINVQSAAERQLRACATELGMTPSSRSRVQAAPTELGEPAGKGRFRVVG
jgi:P27 family predicted phage terminase small subunit